VIPLINVMLEELSLADTPLGASLPANKSFVFALHCADSLSYHFSVSSKRRRETWLEHIHFSSIKRRDAKLVDLSSAATEGLHTMRKLVFGDPPVLDATQIEAHTPDLLRFFVANDSDAKRAAIAFNNHVVCVTDNGAVCDDGSL
jgi:hypothetical protein